MRNKITLAVVSLMTLLFSACSDGGDASFKNGETLISLSSVQCVTGNPTSNDIANYETLLSGDTLVKEDDNATVIIYHDAAGVKKVCLINNGSSAHILR